MSSYKALSSLIDEAEAARGRVAQNHGHEKEQAREAYEAVVEELGEILVVAIEDAVGDLDSRQIESLARTLQKMLWRKKVLK